MKVGDIMKKKKEFFMELDDTVDIGKEPAKIEDEKEQKFHDELMAKIKKKYNIK